MLSFSEYEKLVNGHEVTCERVAQPDANNEPSFSAQFKPRQKAISCPIATVTRKQRRGISKRKTQQRKKVASRRASRTKRTLASSFHEYQYIHQGEAYRASNGWIY